MYHLFLFFISSLSIIYRVSGQYAQSCVSTIAGKLPSVTSTNVLTDESGGNVALDWLATVLHKPSSDGYGIYLPTYAGPGFKYPAVSQLGTTNYLSVIAGGVAKTIDDRIANKRALPGGVASIRMTDSGIIYFACNCGVFSVLPSTGFITHVAFLETTSGYAGDGGPARIAKASSWLHVAPSADNRFVYVCDIWNSLIRKVDISTGIVTRFAGTYCDPDKQSCPTHMDKLFTQDGIPATSALLNLPWDVAVDSNFVYILDTWFHRVRKVSLSTGLISTIAGMGMKGADYGKSSGDGGPGIAAWLDRPRSLSVAPNGDVYVADSDSHSIRKISVTTGIITTIAGKSKVNSNCIGNGGDGGPAWNSTLNGPWGFDVASDGSILIGDCGRLRMINPVTGIIDTIPVLGGPAPVSLPSGNKTLSATNTSIGGSYGITAANVDKTAFYFCDISNHVVYYFDPTKSIISLYAGTLGVWGFSGDGGLATKARLDSPVGVTMRISTGDVYIADKNNKRIRKVTRATGIISTFAGSGTSGSLYTPGGSPLLAQFINIEQVLVDDLRNRLLFTDYNNNAIYSITLDTYLISVIAGTPGASQVWDTGACDLKGDGGLAVDANLSGPKGLYVTKDGTIVFSDSFNNVIRRIDPVTKIITTIVGKPCIYQAVEPLGTSRLVADGDLPLQSLLSQPYGILIDESNSDLYFTNTWDSSIYVVRNGLVRRVAGKYDQGFLDGATAKDALFRGPSLIIWGAQGSMIVLDRDNSAIRMLPFNMTTSCPPGYYCTCGWNPVACWNSSNFCPKDTATPYITADGFITPESAGLETGSVVHTSQAYCPKGAYCMNGILTPCSAGTYGDSVGHYSSLLSCKKCSPGTFISETGGSSNWGSSACSPCPLGTTGNASGRSFCGACPASTIMKVKGSSSRLCIPCSNGTYALPGSSECFVSAPEDISAIVGQTHSFQRVLPVSSGNLPDRLATLMLYQVISPIAVLSTIPLLFAFILLIALPRGYFSCCGCNAVSNRLSKRYKEWLHSIDSFSMLDADPGKSPINEPSTSGGIVTIIAGTATIALMLSTFVSWITSNNLLSQSVNPLDMRALESFSVLPPKVQITGGVDLPRPLNLVSGFSIEIATQGSLCSSLEASGFSSEVAFGSGFDYSPPSPTNGTLIHTFSCKDCLPNAQSILSISFPPSCQFYLITMTAIGAGGGISATTVSIENEKAPNERLISIGMNFPLNIEIIQDTVNGIADDEGGELYTGGESVTGLFSLPVTGITTRYGPGDDRSGSVSFLIGIPLQPNYKLFTITPMQTFLNMVSSVFAWASAFGLFVYLKQLHRAIKDFSKKPKSGKDIETEEPEPRTKLRGSLARERKSVQSVFNLYRVNTVADRRQSRADEKNGISLDPVTVVDSSSVQVMPMQARVSRWAKR